MPHLAVTIAPGKGWGLRNPVLTASGTFGYGVEFQPFYDIQRLGAIVCKGTTLHPREGNPQPRIWETAAGMLNYIGLQNMGVERLIAEMAPLWATWQVPVVVNIAGESVAEYRELARRLDGVPGVAALEVNISCPNVAKGGMEFGTSPQATCEVVQAVRGATSLPLLVKLSPNVTDILEIARAAVTGGADALTVANTVKGMALDWHGRRPVTGGLSGAAIKPFALYLVHTVAGAVGVPVIGCGGITSAQDALEFLMVGATAVQVGSANLVHPRAALEILEGLEAFMRQEGIESVAELSGMARKRE